MFYRFNTNTILFNLFTLSIMFKVYRPGTVLSPLQILTHLILITPLEGGSSYHPSFVAEKTRLRVEKLQG